MDRATAGRLALSLRPPLRETCYRYAADQLSRARRAGARVLTLWDGDYPASLRNIYDPPPLLFAAGRLPLEDEACIAVVGTRTPTPRGIRLANRFAADLAQAGFVVVSGLARGVDTAAHEGTLRAGGLTLAVTGAGLDVVYPPENRRLQERIAAEGAVLSEFPMGSGPEAAHFPRRNRIISGISIATLVVETGVNGGAMITAASALDQNREVFAIPSAPEGGTKSGTNTLIRQGRAALAESVEDILEDLAPRLGRRLRVPQRAEPPTPPLNPPEQRVASLLGDEPVHVDLLAERSGLPLPEILAHLLSLEFKGWARQLPGKLFLLADPRIR